MTDQRAKRHVTLVAVILVIVVIAVIAFPHWRNHRTASRVDTALKAADAAKVVVAEAATIHGGLAHVKASELGYNPAASINEYVANLAVADGGLITVTTKDTGTRPDIQLLLTPNQDASSNGPVNWTCSVVLGDLDEVPAHCRTKAAAANSTSPEAAKPAASAAAPASSS